MTKKDYDLIARAFRLSEPAYDKAHIGWELALNMVTTLLAVDNKAFNPDRFKMAAVWTSPPQAALSNRSVHEQGLEEKDNL